MGSPQGFTLPLLQCLLLALDLILPLVFTITQTGALLVVLAALASLRFRG
jgi:hypothetical protein